MKQHVLKTDPTVWDATADGRKRFEVRRNDREYQTGDLLVLCRGTESTMPQLHFRAGYILRAGVPFGLRPGFVVIQLESILENYDLDA